MATDTMYMQRALDLAVKGRGLTYPNPMVGAVVVKAGRIIGEGWHRGPGQPHAEAAALANCCESPEGATLYVTLEPCNHFGKTPPCTDAIIRAGIAEVKYAVTDPNPKVTGGGAQRLLEAGIRVSTGLLKAEAVELNRMFFHYCLKGRPWVILKAGISLDAKLTSTSGESRWITSEASRQMVHELRSEVGAVLIGRGTLQADNPRLTCRLDRPVPRQPFKILLDNKLSLGLDSNLLAATPEKVIIFCGPEAPVEKEAALQKLGARVVRQPQGEKEPLRSVLKFLAELGVQSVLVEGGSQIFTSFINADLVNEYYLYYAPLLIGGATALPLFGGAGFASLKEARRLKVNQVYQVGTDLCVHAYKEELAKCLLV
ncbi:MAG TPA: bifunctional diaminohydroxyphosphoribosylaminopyrimidine deaminase/5-amino-6-(5-phosphoribosylamino)uracil reductase RibD [Bacillota bacterium]